MQKIDVLNSLFGPGVEVRADRVTVTRPKDLQAAGMDALVRSAVFGDDLERDHARWLIWELAQSVGVRPASIHDLYSARGRGEVKGFTVPAINVRGMAYDTARSIFRTANKLNAGAFILEIARSEIAYTDQRPAEYVAVVLAAASSRGSSRGLGCSSRAITSRSTPRSFAVDARTEVEAVKTLAREAIAAGFFNIDIDTSTLVDLSKSSLDEQQRLNYEVGVDIARSFARTSPLGSVFRWVARSARWGRRTAPSRSCGPTWTASTGRFHREWSASRRSACNQGRRMAESCWPMARSRT